MSIQVIPAIDLIGGECVRLTQGDYAQKKTYSSSPADVAGRFEDAGVRRLHLVDLDGAKASMPQNLKILEDIKKSTSLKVEFGGGIKSKEALQKVFDAGADFAICGSIAVTSPEEMDGFISAFGGEKIILGADIRNGMVSTHGWLKDSTLSADDLLARFPGVKGAVITDISRDGMLSGIDISLYTRLQTAFPSTDIVVSGGISSSGDVHSLEAAGLRAVIVGKAIYEGRITFEELESLCSQSE